MYKVNSFVYLFAFIHTNTLHVLIFIHDNKFDVQERDRMLQKDIFMQSADEVTTALAISTTEVQEGKTVNKMH